MEILTTFYESVNTLLEVYESLSNSRVEGDHCRCTVSLRTYCTELEAVTCECEWRCTVTVGVINEKLWN